MKIPAKRVIVLLSKYHGSNQQLLALAKVIAGDNVKAIHCEMRSRSSLLVGLYKLVIALNRKLGSKSLLARLLTKTCLKNSVTCLPDDLVLAKTRPFEIPAQLLVAGSGAKIGYIGSPSRFPHKAYDYLISTPSTPTSNAYLKLDVLPTSFTYQEYLTLRSEQTLEDQKTWLLLLGGEARGCEYTQQDWATLISFILSSNDAQDVSWLISTSPRTGEVVEKLLAQSLVSEKGFKGKLYLWGGMQQNCPKPLELLARSDEVFVSEDSASMISEAVVTRLPVVTFSSDGSDMKNGLTLPLLKYLDSKKCLKRSTFASLSVDGIEDWKKNDFTSLTECWSEVNT
jgi:mitochondrial fission protein ELM1